MVKVEDNSPADLVFSLEDALLWRPPLPVGEADISDIIEQSLGIEAKEPGYAWERLPRWIAEIEDTFKKSSEVPVVQLDLGSSLSLNVQMMRALEFKRCGERARDLVDELFSRTPDSEPSDTWFGHIDYAVKHATAKNKGAVVGSKTLRNLLESAVQEVLYTRNSDDMVGGDESVKRLTDRYSSQLLTQSDTYHFERGGEDTESRWQIKARSQEEPCTYFEYISAVKCRSRAAIRAGKRMAVNGFNKDDMEIAQQKVAIGENLAAEYIYWQATVLASLTANNSRYRPARFISVDRTAPIDIALSSLVNTPQSTRNMNLFSHAIKSLFDPNQHIQADIFEPLPVPDNSVTLITCFDAWPFHSSFEGMTDEEKQTAIFAAVETIYGWYKKLTYGGKIVIFPWETQDRNQNSRKILEEVTTQISLLIGHDYKESSFHVASLRELLSEADAVTATSLSDVFGTVDSNRIGSLIVEKPHKKLVDRHAKALGHRLLTAAQTQSLPDPTP